MAAVTSSLHLGGIGSLPAVTGPSTARRPNPTEGSSTASQRQPLTARRPSENNNAAATAVVHNVNHFTGHSSQPASMTGTSSGAAPLLPPISGGGGGEHVPSVGADIVSFQHHLTPYEKQEIQGYPERYYYGQNCSTKVASPVANGINFGYDDDRGDYSLIMYDHVCYRYEIVGFLGKGSFGQVAKVFDHKRQTLMALKVLRNKKKFHQQAQVEIKVLLHLRNRDPDGKYGIVQIHDTFTFRSHICLTYELLSMNLYDYLKNSKFTPMSLPAVKKIGASVLISLAFMWREGIIHCDLKPENILLRQPNRTGVKVIDLGSACFENERLYTYIQSRFYRAPEVILGIPYTRRIDLWSYACVLCELATGIPIFPGESESEQLALIMEYLNVPPPEIVAQSPHRGKFFESSGAPKLIPNSRKKIRTPNTKSIHGFLGLPPDDLFVSFINMFLTWDPEERPTPEQAMRHPWICDAYVGLTPSMPAVNRRYLPVGDREKGGATTPRNPTGDSNKPSSRRHQRQQGGVVPHPPTGGNGGDSSNVDQSTTSGPCGASSSNEGVTVMGNGGAPKLPSVPQPKVKNPRKVIV